jgi:hypothetical protein
MLREAALGLRLLRKCGRRLMTTSRGTTPNGPGKGVAGAGVPPTVMSLIGCRKPSKRRRQGRRKLPNSKVRNAHFIWDHYQGNIVGAENIYMRGDQNE